MFRAFSPPLSFDVIFLALQARLVCFAPLARKMGRRYPGGMFRAFSPPLSFDIIFLALQARLVCFAPVGRKMASPPGRKSAWHHSLVWRRLPGGDLKGIDMRIRAIYTPSANRAVNFPDDAQCTGVLFRKR